MHCFALMLVLLAPVAASSSATGSGSAALLQSAAGAPQSGTAFQGLVDLPGVHLWYTDSGGSGVPIILLHAFTGNSDSWENNTPALVQAGYRVIGFDRRGWGRSIADPASGLQPGTAADDLQALVEYLALDRFHIVGIAGGGFVAYDYALWRPERLRSLVVAASSGGVTGYFSAGHRSLQLPGFADWPVQYKEVGVAYLAANPEGTDRWLAIHESSQQPGAASQPLRTSNSLASLETIRVPTMLIQGTNDLLSSPNLMRIQAQYLPDAQFVLIPEAGHAINWEQPEVFNLTVLDFIGRY